MLLSVPAAAQLLGTWRLAAVLVGAELFSATADAHHLEENRLELRTVRGAGLQGRFFLAPADFDAETPQELLTRLRDSIGLLVNDRACNPDLDLVERWDQASPSPGHLIDLRCALKPVTRAPQIDVTWQGRGTLTVVLPASTAETPPPASPPLVTGQTGHFTVPLAPAPSPSSKPPAQNGTGLTPTARRDSPPLPTEPPSFATLLRLGYRHVVPAGLDHVMFVFSLALLATSVRTLLAWLLAFTVGHAIGLVSAAYGWLPLPPSIVEPGIAISIVFVATRGTLAERKPPDQRRRQTAKPWRRSLAALSFGVLHGLGFGQVFSQLRLDGAGLIGALVAFHLGIEAGHALMLGVGGLLFAALIHVLAPCGLAHRQLRQLSSAGIALAGLVLLARRLSMF